MRFVLAEMMHETNTFSPIPTPLEAFAVGTGRAGPALGTAAALDRFEGTNTSLGGLIQVAREAGAAITLPIAGGAPPSGPVDDAAFETFAGAITDAIAAGCDAVLLALHGAMATESHDDGEGELLRRIRALAPQVPIAVALDFHTNLTARWSTTRRSSPATAPTRIWTWRRPACAPAGCWCGRSAAKSRRCCARPRCRC